MDWVLVERLLHLQKKVEVCGVWCACISAVPLRPAMRSRHCEVLVSEETLFFPYLRSVVPSFTAPSHNGRHQIWAELLECTLAAIGNHCELAKTSRV